MIPRTAGVPKFRFHGAFPEPRRIFVVCSIPFKKRLTL